MHFWLSAAQCLILKHLKHFLSYFLDWNPIAVPTKSCLPIFNAHITPELWNKIDELAIGKRVIILTKWDLWETWISLSFDHCKLKRQDLKFLGDILSCYTWRCVGDLVTVDLLFMSIVTKVSKGRLFNVRPAFFYTKSFVFNSVAICLIMIKHHITFNIHIILFSVPKFTVRSFKDGCAEFFEI